MTDQTLKDDDAGTPRPPAPPVPTTLSSEPSPSDTGAVPTPASPPPFPIVGIGASAGGLAAFEAFFSAIPADTPTGMAFVLVQHQSPDHKSLLADLIKRYTSMRVQNIEDGMRIEPDHAYIIPPNVDLALYQGQLHLLEPSAPHGLRLPIDFFFRSLAQDQHERAIGIVLSGTGSDGTLGIRAIKGEGGMAMVQAPKTADYDGMPRSALATGLVDVVLPPAEMPAALIAYATHAFGKASPPITPTAEDALIRICILLRDRTTHDFSHYKQSTLVRRIERRMALHQLERQTDYLRYLRQEPSEIDALFRDLLIGVTHFFRDPDAFDVLEQQIIPRLFANQRAGTPIRFWVCGCSTGEEVYSLAILVREHLEHLRQTFKVQIFATDIDAHAIEVARHGVYPASIATDVSPERLARFFTADTEQGSYRIQKVIRDLVIFSEQDLLKDPPFSRLDLISCRNLLIYLTSEAQKRLIPLFHYALNPGGTLFLGNSETIGESFNLFTPFNRKWKIYLRQDRLSEEPAIPAYTAAFHTLYEPRTLPSARATGQALIHKTDPRTLTEAALLRHFDVTGLLIDARGDILHIHGRTGQYLEPAVGAPRMNVLSMAREGLRRALTSALHHAVAQRKMVHLPDLSVRSNGGFRITDLTVRPLHAGSGQGSEDLFLVVLEATPGTDGSETATEPLPSGRHEGRIAELEWNLRTKEESLQTTLEEMETSNEELKSTNEEMQSVNEELQSSNEELETSKEELQSVNEELATVNAELQMKVADLSRANNDMNNLLAGTGVATLFVDHQLRITRFTPAATQLIKLIRTDLGRPIGDIVSNMVDYTDLVADIESVLKTLAPLEKEVQTRSGVWYLLRIGPYRTLDNVIEGAVITFLDITSRKYMEDALRAARVLAEGVVDRVREPLLVLDHERRVISANQAFYRHFALGRADLRGQRLEQLDQRGWAIPDLLASLERVRATGEPREGFQFSHVFPRIGWRQLRATLHRLDTVPNDTPILLLTLEDVTAPSADGEPVDH